MVVGRERLNPSLIANITTQPVQLCMVDRIFLTRVILSNRGHTLEESSAPQIQFAWASLDCSRTGIIEIAAAAADPYAPAAACA